MNNKFLKTLAYAFMFSALAWIFIVIGKPKVNGIEIVKYICLAIMAIVFVIMLILYMFCNKDNKKISAMLDNNDYDNLIEYATKKYDKKFILLNERKFYYEYLIILCHFCLNNEEKMKETIYEFTEKDTFPMTYFWMACLEFSQGKYDNITKYYESFVYNADVRRKTAQLYNFINIFYSLHLYVEGEKEKAKENLKEKVDVSKVSMDVTLKAIGIINSYEPTIDNQETTNE